ncbi:MAG: hypothetical protein KBD94_05730 [Pyrinomonadaceae bacterium]|nr:hypothetical protein [Pyrinomonadaceae bacterium]
MKTYILKAARLLPVAALLLLGSFSMANVGTLGHTFENKTGKTAYDLHIKYNRQAKVVSQDPEVFDKVDDGGEDGRNTIDLSEGSVVNGGKVKVKAEAKSGDLEINKWWWTDKDHNRIGKENDGCKAADGCSTDVSGPAGSAGAVSTASGLTNVVFDLPQAKITVYLPDDMAAGDTISGTVIAEPNPGYVQDNSPNAETLTGVVVDLGDGQKVPVCDPCSALRSFVLPHVFEQIGRVINVSLVQPGHASVTTRVPLQPASGLPTWDPNIPPFAQTGRPATITGPFDGNSSNTQVTVASQKGVILAESRRKMILRTPGNLTGPVQVTATDNGKTTTGQMRILNLQLTSAKTKLTRGEETKVHMEIKGIKGETRNVPVRVVTSGTANMQGGNQQDITITPSQIGTDGTFVRDFTLIGTSTGAFSVTATVNTNPQPVAGENKCKCVCEFANPQIITAGTKQVKGGWQHSFEPNMKNAACNGNQCSVAKIDYSWSVGAGSTATYTIVGGISTAKILTIEATKAGTVDLSVTVTVTCSDGTACTASGSKSFRVKG